MKILHLADCGLKNLPYGGINPTTGLNRRFEDICNNFRSTIQIATESGCKYFIIAGDVNEERNPDSLCVEKFSTFVADIVGLDINVIMIAGNHDLDSSKSTSTSVSFIKALGLVNTYVADLGPEIFDFPDVRFVCLPYMFPHQAGVKDNHELTMWLNSYISSVKVAPFKPTILVAHYSLDVTFAGLDVNEPTIAIDGLSKFDYVALGHIHKYEMFSSFVGGYTGSMFTKDFGESNEKYVNVVTIYDDRKVIIEPIQLPERRFVQLDLDMPDASQGVMELLEEKIEEIEGGIADCVVKVKITTPKRFDPKIIYDRLKIAQVFHHTPIDWRVAKVSEVKQLDGGVDDRQIIESYFDEDKDPSGETKEYVVGVIDKWCEIYM